MSYLRNYIEDNDFKFSYYNNQLDIINYLKINYLEDSKISLKYQNGNVVIKGENLRIKKLLDDELLIVGNIGNIEFKDW